MDKTQRPLDLARFSLGNGMTYRAEPTVASARRHEDGPMSVEQWNNARREAEYVARRNGLKEPLLQLWKVVH